MCACMYVWLTITWRFGLRAQSISYLVVVTCKRGRALLREDFSCRRTGGSVFRLFLEPLDLSRRMFSLFFFPPSLSCASDQSEKYLLALKSGLYCIADYRAGRLLPTDSSVAFGVRVRSSASDDPSCWSSNRSAAVNR